MKPTTVIKLIIAAVFAVAALTIASQLEAQEPTLVVPPPQCVKVLIVDRDGRSGGTGALIGPRLVVTANHVIKDRKSSKCEILFPNWQLVQAKVIKVDTKQDLALIQLATNGPCSPLTLSRQKYWKPGDAFCVMGYGYSPFRAAWGKLNTDKWKNYREVKGASARSGDSGGPVLDAKGGFAGTLWGSDGSGTMFTPVDVVVAFAGKYLKVTPVPDGLNPDTLPYTFDEDNQ